MLYRVVTHEFYDNTCANTIDETHETKIVDAENLGVLYLRLFGLRKIYDTRDEAFGDCGDNFVDCEVDIVYRRDNVIVSEGTFCDDSWETIYKIEEL